MTRKSEKGMALITVLLLLTVLAVFIPAFVRWLQTESKETVRESKKMSAFHMAEVGQDRGSWKLRESDAVWNNATLNSPPANYDGSFEFTDVEGGSYKVQILAGPLSSQVWVISKGKASNTNEIRAIRALYTKGSVTGAMGVSGGLTWRPNMNVEWGPVVAYTSIDSTPANYYPRKYSAGQIVGRDTNPAAPNGAMPSADWITYDYASYYSLGNPPSYDLAAYKTLAINTTVVSSGTNKTATPVKSGYFGSQDVSISNNFDYTNSTGVIFIDSGGQLKKFPNSAFLDLKALIVRGPCDFNANGKDYVAAIPATAQEEYQYPTAATYWTSKGWAAPGTTTIHNVGFHGFLYCEGDMANAGGGAIMVGSIYISGDVSINTFTVYYDATVGSNVLYKNQTITRTSWDEILTSW